MNSGLFASGLGRGSRMHIDSLGGSPQTPPTRMPTRAVQPLQYFGQQQPGNGMPLSHLQRLFNAAQDARQKKLMIRSFGGKELYVGLGSGFLEWGRRFERQANIAQSACGFPWPKDVKVDLFGHYMAGTAANYFNKQVDAWWAQLPTLQYVMEKMLETFKTTITPAQAMKLFTATKDPKRSWPEHYMYLVVISEACGNSADYLVLNNIVQYASADLRTVLMAKVDGSQTDYLQHAEELAQFAQSWEIETGKGKNFGRDVVSSVRERRKETRRCHKCGEVGRLRAACPARNNPDIVHLVNDASYLDDVDQCDDQCVQPIGEPLAISMKGSVTLRVAACGVEQIVRLSNVYFAKNVVHNLVSYGQLLKVGYTLAHRDPDA
ncbi:hypothetical protein PHMEG_00013752 [Phytophthora megakarya]|uniref:CCHC-type domain-containing protein n=1 Tax=Phytophthora megakarya TaxID=4795 RepID=A0A225W5I8_9STRA|nr:hypothetical protein PHMEG_00013752 [Phytophthora megakarya]